MIARPLLRSLALALAVGTTVKAFTPAAVRSSVSSPALSSSMAYLETLHPTPEERIDGGVFVNETQRLQHSNFSIAPAQLIELAKDAIRAGLGTVDDSILADEFEFCAPVVGPLDKEEYLGALGSFKLLEAFPDMDNRFYNFHVDPFEFNRVWYNIRPLATHTGSLLGKKPTGKKLELPPQAQSLTFDENGKVTQVTIGYVMDRRVGNTGGLGGAFGLFYGVGQGLPIPECRPYKKSLAFRALGWLSKLGKFVQRKKKTEN